MANGVSEMRLDWGSVRTLHGVGLDPGLVEAVVSARDMEQGHRSLFSGRLVAFMGNDIMMARPHEVQWFTKTISTTS